MSDKSNEIALKPRDRQPPTRRRLNWVAVRRFTNAHGRNVTLARIARIKRDVRDLPPVG